LPLAEGRQDGFETETTMLNFQQKLKRVVASVQLLASEADVQLSAFPDGVCKPDEIVLTFGECGMFVKELSAVGLLSKNDQDLLLRLEGRIVSLGGGKESIWSESAVREDPEWAELRQLARATLKEMGVSEQVPDIDWNTYVLNPPDVPKDPD
jgi:hypothetical protein